MVPRGLHVLIGSVGKSSQEACPWNAGKLVQVTAETDYLPRAGRFLGGGGGAGGWDDAAADDPSQTPQASGRPPLRHD